MGDDGAVAADKERGKQSVRDMVISLVVIILAAGVIYVFVPHGKSKDPVVKPVSYRVELDSARRAAPYPVAAPAGLSAKWRATSVQYRGTGEHRAAWHLGFMTPENEYAAVEQSSAARPARFVRDVTQQAEKTSQTKTIKGQKWTRWQGAKYDAWVREVPDGDQQGGGKGPFTTVVTGTASEGRLAQLAGALSTDRGQREAQRGSPQAPAGGPAVS